jgi:hypothetical protein
MDLGDKPSNRRKIYGTGMPLDASVDGRLILTSRTPQNAQPDVNAEIWVVDTAANTEKKLAKGNGPMFLGVKSTHVLFFTGYESKIYISALDGTPPVPIEGASRYMTGPRACLGGSGAVMGASLRNGQPEYEAVFVGLDSRRVTTIASLGCDKVTFQSPAKMKRSE